MVCLWSAGLSGSAFCILKLTGLLRISEEIEDTGMDSHHHSPPKAAWDGEMLGLMGSWGLKGSGRSWEVEGTLVDQDLLLGGLDGESTPHGRPMPSAALLTRDPSETGTWVPMSAVPRHCQWFFR